MKLTSNPEAEATSATKAVMVAGSICPAVWSELINCRVHNTRHSAVSVLTKPRERGVERRGELEKRGRFSVVCLVGLLVVSGGGKTDR